MKKNLLIIVFLASAGIGLAQSQRTVLAEEFSQASCSSCATQNPAFNTLLNANISKVVSIKYQASWPGFDPMNTQDPTDVASRISYYSVLGIPYSPLDGVPQTGLSSTGEPANYTQAKIDTEFAVPSPFTMNISHTFSADYDSIFVTCVITASQAYTSSGTLKAQIAMVEETIHFNSPPGTNGETDFYNVCRKMYPSATGTTLPGTWTSGQTQTITFGAPVPSYIYSKGQIKMVAFIQSDGDKQVQQAGQDTIQPLTSDIGVTLITGIPAYQCSTNFTPSVTIKNFGSTTLTGCTINYTVDSGTIMTYPWTGSLAKDSSVIVTLPAITAPAGAHTFTCYTSAPNGGIDFDQVNDLQSQPFVLINFPGTIAPLSEGFVSTIFPPAEWFINNPDKDATWTKNTTVGGFGLSSECAKLGFNAIPAGEVDELFAKNVDYTGTTTATLTFNVAYARYSASFVDKLEVKVSIDCGMTWTTVYGKSGAALATNGGASVTSSFTPTSTEWRNEAVSLNAFAGQPNVMVKFVGTSGFGNNVYIDDINLTTGSLGVSDNELENKAIIFPNPIAGNATIIFTLPESDNVIIEILNSLGQIVSTNNLGTLSSGDKSYSLDVSNINNGLYFINIRVGNKSIVKKVAIIK